MAGMRTPPAREASDYFLRQGMDADALADELATPAQRRRYIATFYTSRFWAHPGAFMGDAARVFGPFGGTDAGGLPHRALRRRGQAAGLVRGLRERVRPARRREPALLARNDAVRALLLFGPSDHVIYPDFDEMAAVVFPDHDGPHRLSDCGHFVPWEAPDELVAHLTRFCADLLACPADAQTLRKEGPPTPASARPRPSGRRRPCRRGVDAGAGPVRLAGEPGLADLGDEPGPDRVGRPGVAAPQQGDEHVALLARWSRSCTRSWLRGAARDGEQAVVGEQRADVGLEGLQAEQLDGQHRVARLEGEDRVGEVLGRRHARGRAPDRRCLLDGPAGDPAVRVEVPASSTALSSRTSAVRRAPRSGFATTSRAPSGSNRGASSA